MTKTYYRNGRTYKFIDVHVEAGMLCGRWVHPTFQNKWAWLDPNGFQFEGERRIEAREVFNSVPSGIPQGYHYWGGEIRKNYGGQVKRYMI